MTKKEQIAWAAGIFEGEGCIGYWEKSRVLRASVVNTNMEVLTRFQEVVGVGSIYPMRPASGNRRDCWMWATNRAEDAIFVIGLFFDILTERRQEQALDAIHRHDNRPMRGCKGCGVALEEKTEGCKQCYFRHWRRARAVA
jgi:hypothetical protein